MPVPDERVRQAIGVIHSNYAQVLPEAEVAREVGLSLSQFAHLFRRHTGITPHQMVNALRHQEAVRLLAETQLPIKEVAWRTGFRTSAGFSRFFRGMSGTTAREYRTKVACTGSNAPQKSQKRITESD